MIGFQHTPPIIGGIYHQGRLIGHNGWGSGGGGGRVVGLIPGGGWPSGPHVVGGASAFRGLPPPPPTGQIPGTGQPYAGVGGVPSGQLPPSAYGQIPPLPPGASGRLDPYYAQSFPQTPGSRLV